MLFKYGPGANLTIFFKIINGPEPLEHMVQDATCIFFSVVNICIELSLYAVAVRFLDYRFFLL